MRWTVKTDNLACRGTGNFHLHFSRQGKQREFTPEQLEYVFTQGTYLQHRDNFKLLK